MSAEPLELVPDEQTPKWAAAFVAAQAEFPAIEKKRTANTGSYSYSYADLGDIIHEVRPVLARHGLAVSQDVQVRDGKVSCYTMIVHSSGESRTFGPIEFPAGPNPQTAGSAITYAKRYGESAALNLATEEDDDAQHASKSEAKPQRRKPVPSGPQSDSAPTHTRDEQPQDSKATADNAAADVARKGNETPEELAAALGAPPASSPSKLEAVKALRDALQQLHPGNVVWRQREKQICVDHNVDSLEQIDELKLQTETHNVLSKVKS